MDLIPFEVKDIHLIAALVVKILIIAFAWWKIKFLTALAGGLDQEKRQLSEKIDTHKDNEAVLTKEIGELNEEIAILNEDLDHARSNSSDFENEMGNAQHECLRLEERIKALKGDNEDLQKKLASQKAHHGKQKKSIEGKTQRIENLEKAISKISVPINAALKSGYMMLENQYFKVNRITAPSQKKTAKEVLDNLKEQQQ